MPTLKVQCPECEANIRKPFDAVEEPTEIEITCPKCKLEFTTTVEPPQAPKPKAEKPADKKAAKKPAKAAPRDDDEDDDTPRKKKGKKQKDGGSNQKLLIGIGAGVLGIAVIVGAIFAFSGGDKKDTAKGDSSTPAPSPTPGAGAGVNPGAGVTPGVGVNPVGTPGTTPGTVPGGVPGSTPGTTPGTIPGTTPGTIPGTTPGTIPGTIPGTTPGTIPGTIPGTTPGTIPGTIPGTTPGTGTIPKKNPVGPLKLPDPPKLKFSGTMVTDKTPSAVKPPPIPPLAPDEDPFARAKSFRPESLPPPLPKLPPVAQRPILTLDSGGHSQFVINSFVTPKGDRVITVSMDKAVRIWDTQTGDAVETLRLPAGPGEEGALQAAALSPNGKRLAVGGQPVKGIKSTGVPVFIINAENATLLKTITVGPAAVMGLDYSADGKQLVASCLDGSLRLFDATTGNPVANGVLQGAFARDVRFNPKSKVLATLDLDGIVKLWDLAKPGRPATADLDKFRPNALAWSPDGQTLAAVGDTGEIVFLGLDARPVRSFPKRNHEGGTLKLKKVQFLSGGELVCCGVGGKARGWAGVIDVNDGKVKAACTEHTNAVDALGVSSDGAFVVSSGGNQHESYVWNAVTGKTISRLCGPGFGMWAVGWAKDGKSLAYGHSNETAENGTRPLDYLFKLDDFGASGISDESKYDQALTEDGTFAWLRAGPNEIKIGAKTGKPLLYEGDGRIYSASILPGRRMVAVAGAASLALVDATSGKKIRDFIGHAGNVLSVAPSPDGKYLVSGGSDQTIRIWRMDDDDPVLSIFVAGKEWIAWTPQGFYACSANGEKLIAWQINGGNAKFPQVHPASRFRTSLYQPALIKYLIPAGNMQLALAMATKFDKALVQTTNIADIIPPEVTIDYPAPPTPGKEDSAPLVVDQEKVTVKASAKGAKHPITAMRLLVDGRPFMGSAGVKRFDKPDLTAEASWEVSLTPGPHSFAVIADSTVSKGMSKVSVLTRSGEPPKPNLYVLAVGVSKYPIGINSLKYCATDAKLLAKAFQSKSKTIFKDIEVRVLTDSDATKKGIQEGLDWLKSKMTPNDVGIVSFSGHGGKGDFNDKFYLIPSDAKPGDTEGSCFAGDELKRRLEDMPGRLVAILDACHSGAVAEGSRPVKADGLVRDLVAEDAGVIVMCASAGSEFSWEHPLANAGLYTFALAEGMDGHADIDGDGVVYIHELDVYAGARVAQLCHTLFGVRQTPTIGRPPGIRLFPIAKP